MCCMYDTVETTVQFCLQKPNVHNSTLLKNTYEVALTCLSIAPCSTLRTWSVRPENHFPGFLIIFNLNSGYPGVNL